MIRDEDMDLIPGTGNVFRDFSDPNADLEQARAIIAAKIIEAMDERQLSAQAAAEATGVAAAEFSRIRKVALSRFTLDRMIKILGKLDRDVEVTIDVRSRSARGIEGDRAA